MLFARVRKGQEKTLSLFQLTFGCVKGELQRSAFAIVDQGTVAVGILRFSSERKYQSNYVQCIVTSW